MHFQNVCSEFYQISDDFCCSTVHFDNIKVFLTIWTETCRSKYTDVLTVNFNILYGS
jgi:hypothetical protein